MVISHFIFLLQAEKPTDVERQIMLLIIAAFVGAFFTWLFNRARQHKADQRDDAKTIADIQEKIALWINRFQDVKREAIALEDKLYEIRAQLREALETIENDEELKEKINKFLDQVERILHQFDEHAPLLVKLREIKTELEPKEPETVK